jgi:hypothetical protein
MEFDTSLPWLQEIDTGSVSKPDEFRPKRQTPPLVLFLTLRLDRQESFWGGGGGEGRPVRKADTHTANC